MEIINLIEIADMGDQFIKLEKALNSEYTMVIENRRTCKILFINIVL